MYCWIHIHCWASYVLPGDIAGAFSGTFSSTASVGSGWGPALVFVVSMGLVVDSTFLPLPNPLATSIWTQKLVYGFWAVSMSSSPHLTEVQNIGFSSSSSSPHSSTSDLLEGETSPPHFPLPPLNPSPTSWTQPLIPHLDPPVISLHSPRAQMPESTTDPPVCMWQGPMASESGSSKQPISIRKRNAIMIVCHP